MTEKNNIVPFHLRYGQNNAKPISDDFPRSAKTGLTYLIEDIINRRYIIGSDYTESWAKIFNELYRVARIQRDYTDRWSNNQDEFNWLLEQLEWFKVYSFCERVYDKLLGQVNDNDLMQVIATIEEVKIFSDEINNLLYEENLDYKFVNGLFERAGRIQTQKSIKKMGSILSSSELILARHHYNKAIKFFNDKPVPDLNNCVKEAMCAFESCIEVTTGKSASKNFTKAIRDLQNDDAVKIPPTIAESIIKVYAFRGDSQGVAHSSPEGYIISQIEAELILNLVASYITYIIDLAEASKEEIPF